MNIFDIVEVNGERGLVVRVDAQIHTVHIRTLTSTLEEIDDLDVVEPERCKIIVNPLASWPFLKIQDKPRYGLFLHPLIPVNGQLQELRQFYDWVCTGIGTTRSIYLSTALRLRPGSMLQAVYEKGVTRLSVPPNFGTVTQRIAKATPKVEEVKEQNAFSMLLGDDEIEE